MTNWSKVLLVGIIPFILFLSACKPIASTGQSNLSNTQFVIDADTTLGQTFTSCQDGLTGIKIFLTTTNTAPETVLLSIFESPQRSRLISSSTLYLQQGDDDGYYTFLLETPISSYLTDFYLELKTISAQPLGVGSAEVSSYLDGTLYQSGVPELAQLTFTPLYDPWKLALGLLRQGLEWLIWLVAAAYLFIVPGYGLLVSFWKKFWDWPWLVKISIAAAVSLSLYPILMLFTHLLKLQLGVYYSILPGAISTFYLLIHWIKAGKKLSIFQLKRLFVLSELHTFVSALVILLLIFTRFWAIRALPLPMWGDTIHHTMIAQLMIDNGGLFESWAPLAEMQSMNYHFGFHSAVAVFAWLTGTASPKATLIVGQLMNIFAVIAVYGLSWKMTRRNYWAGIIAIVIAGLISFLPMFYVNWSRYTQLAGQVVLPVLILITWYVSEGDFFRPREGILIGFLTAGLALIHYRVVVFFLAIVPILIIAYLRKHNWRPQVINWGIAGGVGILLILPWFIKIYGGRLFTHMTQQVSTPPNNVGEFTQQYNAIGPFTNYLPEILWILLLLAIIFGLWRKEKGTAILLGWWLILFLIANPAILNLPGTGAINNFAIFIAIYIPTGIGIGASIGWLIERPLINWPKTTQWLLTIVIISVSLVGGKDRLRDVQPDTYALATRADMRAFVWIQDNLPKNAHILVNSFMAYGGTSVVGSDAGWWIPMLTGRLTTLPPMLYGTEQPPFPGYALTVNEFRLSAERLGFANPKFVAELIKQGIKYAFIGQKQGRVNYGGSIVLNPEELIASGLYSPIYHQDAVWVFEINPNQE